MDNPAKFRDVSLVLLRLIVGAIFIYAGYAKFGMWSMEPTEAMPEGMLMLMKFLSIVEPLGGVALIAGFLTFWASAGLAVIMVGATILMKFMMGVGFMTESGPGWSFPATLLVCCIVLMAFGAGSWSVDAKRKK